MCIVRGLHQFGAVQMTTQFLSPKAVCSKTSLSRPTIERLIAEGRFPTPIRITPYRLAFRADVIEQWMAEREVAPA